MAVKGTPVKFINMAAVKKRSVTTTTPHLSTAIATRVNTDADTDIPWTMPLILHTRLPNGQPVEPSKKYIRI